MAEKKFEAGQRIREIDGNEHVLVVDLLCPICVAEGKTESVATPATRAWRPNLPQLEKVAETQLPFSKLIEETNRGRRAKLLCADHGLQVRKAGIRTQMFHIVLERARERRQEQELGTIANILGGAKVAEIKAAVEKPVKEGRGQGRGERKREGSPKNPPYRRSQAKAETKEEIRAAEEASQETS